jgi:hypothetical protein
MHGGLAVLGVLAIATDDGRISRKRNEAVDSGIVELDGSRTLGRDERELDAPAGVSGALFAEDLLDATEDQALGGAAYVGGAGLEALVKGGGDVDGSAHMGRLPNLWLGGNGKDAG